jgi:hypothetical protein
MRSEFDESASHGEDHSLWSSTELRFLAWAPRELLERPGRENQGATADLGLEGFMDTSLPI